VWALRCLLLLTLLLLGGWFLVARSPLTHAFILPRLESALGVPVAAGDATIRLDGTIVLADVRITTPELRGEPANLLSVSRLVVGMDWTGGPTATRVLLDKPVVRISQSVEDGMLNLELLRFFESPAGAASLDLPTIVIEDAAVELGEHDASSYRELAMLRLAGSLTPASPHQTTAYAVKFAELAPDGSPTGPLRLSGRIAPEEIRLTLAGLKLGRFGPEAVPQPIRSLYAGLDLQGHLEQATFTYNLKEGFLLTLDVDGVDVTPPFSLKQDAPPIRMLDTTGSISISEIGLEAELKGLVEDLPYEVEFQYHGTSPDAPFEARFVTRGFAIGKEPLLLRQLPDLPRKHVLAFSGPTAVVNAFAVITRGPPTPEGPAPIDVVGRLDFRDGWASFTGFPYPFHDMSGSIEFTDSSIRLRRIEGVADTGATLTATGTVEPLTDEAALDLRIDVENAPLDEQLRAGLGPGRGKIIDALFSDAHLERLKERGLLDQDFKIGGRGQVDIHVGREAGPAGLWTTDVDVAFDEVTFLPERFPFPIVGRDVTLRLDADSATLTGGTFTALDGTPLHITASSPLPSSDDPDAAFLPTVELTAHGLTIDPLLIHALPEDAKLPDGRPVSQILTELGVSGSVEGTLAVAPRADGTLGFDADARLEDVSVAPLGTGDTPRLRLHQASGTLRATERLTTLDIEGDVRLARHDGDAGRVAIDLETRYGEHPDLGLECIVTAFELDARATVEDACRVFSGRVADSIERLRARTRPGGVVSGAANIFTVNGEPVVRLTVDDPLDLSFDVLGGRVAFSNLSRPARIDFAGEPVATFDDVELDVAFNEANVGRARATGEVPLSVLAALESDAAMEPPEHPHALQLALTDVPLDSPLVRALATRFARGEIIEKMDEASVQGVFDADITFAVDPAVQEGALTVAGRIKPRAVRFSRPRGDVTVEVLAGHLKFEGDAMRFDDVELSTPEWTAALSGRWMPAEAGDTLTIDFSLDALRLSDDLLALLPLPVADAFDEIDLRVEGPFDLRDGSLRLHYPRDAEVAHVTFDASTRFRNARIDPGMLLTDIHGGADISAETDDRGARYEADVRLEQARALNVLVTDILTTVSSGNTTGEVLVPRFAGTCHGGRVSGFAHVRPFNVDPARREYLLGLELSGVGFHPAISEMRARFSPDAPEPGAPVESARGDRSLLTGSIRLSGVVGEDGTRRGSGLFEVFGGRVIDLPLAVRVIEASNLAFPRNDHLDYARAEIFVEGPVTAFEELSAFSDTIGIIGRGTLTIPETEVDFRFHTRAARRIPLLSPVIETIREELATTRVTGTLGDYRIRLEQFANRDRALAEWLNARKLAEQIMASRSGSDKPDRADAIQPLDPDG